MFWMCSNRLSGQIILFLYNIKDSVIMQFGLYEKHDTMLVDGLVMGANFDVTLGPDWVDNHPLQ